MDEEIAKLESPIDAIGLIHKALLAEAARVEQAAVELDTGGTLQGFKLAFNSWAAALIHISEQEDRYVMSPLTGHLSVRQAKNKAPGSRTSSPEPNRAPPTDTVTVALVALEEELHRELLESVQEVLSVLNEEIGKTSLITRTKQHLYRQVVALRIAQQDHLETEEALVLPVVRRLMDEGQQLEAVRRLLIDEEAEDPRWVIDWVARALDGEERQSLSDLEGRFQELPSLAR
jgi:hypothetical protein